MPLVLAFVALVGAALLLTHGITGASYADVLKGNARQDYATEIGREQAANATLGTAGGAGAGAIPAPSASGYLNPLTHALSFSRTDQGVDATLPVGAPILAPGRVKILGVIRNWYRGQPYVYFQLLNGPDAGKVQYVAEQVTSLAPVGSVLNAGDPIATFAPNGTGIEYGWATRTGQTLARATGGYVEGQVTAAGQSMHQWLQSLGAAL